MRPTTCAQPRAPSHVRSATCVQPRALSHVRALSHAAMSARENATGAVQTATLLTYLVWPEGGAAHAGLQVPDPDGVEFHVIHIIGAISHPTRAGWTNMSNFAQNAPDCSATCHDCVQLCQIATLYTSPVWPWSVDLHVRDGRSQTLKQTRKSA